MNPHLDHIKHPEVVAICERERNPLALYNMGTDLDGIRVLGPHAPYTAVSPGTSRDFHALRREAYWHRRIYLQSAASPSRAAIIEVTDGRPWEQCTLRSPDLDYFLDFLKLRADKVPVVTKDGECRYLFVPDDGCLFAYRPMNGSSQVRAENDLLRFREVPQACRIILGDQMRPVALELKGPNSTLKNTCNVIYEASKLARSRLRLVDYGTGEQA